MEIVITIAIVILVGFILYRSIRKSSKGDCNCGSCSNHCPKYEEKTLKIKK